MARKNEILAREARINCEKWQQHFHYNNEEYHRLHNFVLGRQWTNDEEDTLKTYKKVPLTFNKMATLINSLLGEMQANTPQIEVNPLTNCDEETAGIRAMLVKDLMLSNDAKQVYQVAAAQSATGGYGAYLCDTDYRGNHSFDLDIILRYFKDATRCYWDIGAEETSKIDGLHCGYVQRLTRPKFREKYGRKIEQKILTVYQVIVSKEEIALATDPAVKDDSFSWADDEGITVNHYFKRKFEKAILYKLSNGQILNDEEMQELVDQSRQIKQLMQQQQGQLGEYAGEMQETEPMQEQTPVAELELEGEGGSSRIGGFEIEEEYITLYYEGEPVRIDEKREIKKSKIMHYVIAGDYILEESEFPSEDLPLIFMDQQSFYQKDGKQICRSFIIDAVDAQRYINYLGTQSAFLIKISRYDQFIASKKNVQSLDTQRQWRDPYSVQGAITYDESPSGAKPEQLRPPELSQSLVQQYQRAIDDLYTSTGIYPAQLGQAGNEISGTAINARNRQGSMNTKNFRQSVDRAIAAGGKIINQMIPRVYDTERVINLMSPDEGRKNIVVNKELDPYGMQVQNDIRKGTYEVVLQAGPSYEGQKETALESLQLILQANPQLLNLFADLYADNLPLSNTLEIKNRLKTIVPPEVIEAGKTGKMPSEKGQDQPNPEEQAQQAQMQMQQAQMQMEQEFRMAQLQLKKEELALKAQQMQVELQIEQQKLEAAELEIAGEIKEQELRYLAEDNRTNSDLAISHADNMVKMLMHSAKMTHDKGMAEHKSNKMTPNKLKDEA
jgi:hypothetical protein